MGSPRDVEGLIRIKLLPLYIIFAFHNCDHELEFQNSSQRMVDMFGKLFYLRARNFCEVRES